MKLINKFRLSNLLLICLISIGSLLTGCSKDWLDEKPSLDVAVPATLKDFQAILDQERIFNGSPALAEVATDGHYLLDAIFATRSDQERNAYTWSIIQPYLLIGDWNEVYAKIFDCNVALSKLTDFQAKLSLEQAELSNLRGQARFHRAKAFYEIAQVFAPPFVAETATTDLGIPLRMEVDLNIRSSRSSIRQTYDQIINDLLLAKNELPLKQDYKTRPSKIAAYAMLSRVYLSMENYAQAKIYADSALHSYNVLIDFNTITSSLSFPMLKFNNEVIFHSAMQNYSSVGTQLRVDQSLKDSYLANDLRSLAFFGVSGGLVTFKGSYTGARTNFTGLSTNELYLTLAECLAREGEVTEAMNTLNVLIKTRWKTIGGVSSYANQSATDKTDALKKILNERKKELLIRGLRWTDLRRLNRDPEFAVNLSRTVDGKTYTLEPNSYKYTFPIRADIIQASGLHQNKDW